MEVKSSELKKAVENLHHCLAKLRHKAEVIEKFENHTVWEGTVHIFDIEGHPDTDTCYAWSSPIEGSDKRRFYAVLKVPPIDTPEAAVRASIVAEYKNNG